MKCNCRNQVFEAFGLPECSLQPEKIVKAWFTTELTEKEIGSYTFLPTPVWASNGNLWQGVPFYATPMIDLAESERPDAVKEEIGGNIYHVRNSQRTFKFTFAKKPAEFGRLFEKLRCSSTLGVFLQDINGIIWGVRSGILSNNTSNTAVWEKVAPIPIIASSIDAKLEFAGDKNVNKWVINLQATVAFEDYDLVPIAANSSLLTYNPPIALVATVFNKVSNGARIAIQARFAIGEQVDMLHLTNLTVFPQAYNASGSFISPDTTTWTLDGNVYRLTNIPTDAVGYKYTSSQLATLDDAYDFYHLDIKL